MIPLAVPVLGLHIGASGVATLPNSSPPSRAILRWSAFPTQSPYPGADRRGRRHRLVTEPTSSRSSTASPPTRASGRAPIVTSTTATAPWR